MVEDLFEKSIKYFSKLPGFGPRAGKRVLLHFLKNKDELVPSFISTLAELQEKTTECSECGNITTSSECGICASLNRDSSLLCVVEEVDDLWNLERLGFFKGRYHVLGGSLSAIEGITPEKLNLEKLFKRLASRQVEEVIFANNLSVKGATTVFYIMDRIAEMQNSGEIPRELKMTELANGIPIGANLEYMDEGTVLSAFKSRKSII